MNTIWIIILISGSLPPGKDITLVEYKSKATCEAAVERIEARSHVSAICVSGKKES